MTQELNEKIKDAYDEAQRRNKDGWNCSYTYEEAKQYDPLIHTLFEALMLSDAENLEADQCIIRREKN